MIYYTNTQHWLEGRHSSKNTDRFFVCWLVCFKFYNTFSRENKGKKKKKQRKGVFCEVLIRAMENGTEDSEGGKKRMGTWERWCFWRSHISWLLNPFSWTRVYLLGFCLLENMGERFAEQYVWIAGKGGRMLDTGCIQMLIRFRNQNGSRPSQWIHGGEDMGRDLGRVCWCRGSGNRFPWLLSSEFTNLSFYF